MQLRPLLLKTTSALSFTLLLAAAHAGCDGDGGGPGGISPVSSAGCSSCQTAYTEAQCKAWGDLAGCETAVLKTEDTCMAGIAGCAFTNCKGLPICNDEGSADCASCDGSLTQADCDSLADAAGCDSATTKDFTACGNPAVGCEFLGCDVTPDCN
ncbi:MAG: hypothetical protein R3B70_45615 [Polyangiaceae bacterium]